MIGDIGHLLLRGDFTDADLTAALSTAGEIATLCIDDNSSLRDLSFVMAGQLPQSLLVDGCTALSDLSALEGMRLKTLGINPCRLPLSVLDSLPRLAHLDELALLDVPASARPWRLPTIYPTVTTLSVRDTLVCPLEGLNEWPSLKRIELWGLEPSTTAALASIAQASNIAELQFRPFNWPDSTPPMPHITTLTFMNYRPSPWIDAADFARISEIFPSLSMLRTPRPLLEEHLAELRRLLPNLRTTTFGE
jgi:hypothetical protein